MCKLEIKCVSEGSFCLRNPEHCDGLAHKERHEQTNAVLQRRRFKATFRGFPRKPLCGFIGAS